MFGLTEAEAERLRRPPRRLRVWVVLIELLIAAVALVPIALLDLVSTAEGVRKVVDLAQRGAPHQLDLHDLVPLPTGDWRRPDSWRFLAEGLSFQPANPKAPSWSVARIVAGVAVHRGVDGRFTLSLGDATVSTLVIQAHQQRPPPPWEPVQGPIAAITARTVRIRDAVFDAPPDDPLGPVRAEGIVGSFRDLRFDPGRREVSAQGSVRATSLRTGAITVHDIVLDEFDLERSSLHVEGQLSFAGAPGTLVGDISTFHVRSAVDLWLAIDGLSLAHAVQAATGRPGTVDGELALRLRVRAGGELPRGGSTVEGAGTLRKGRIQLGPRTRYVVLDLLDLAPWVELGPDRTVRLKDMKGWVLFKRGFAALKELTYPVGERTLRLDASVTQGHVHTLVRLLPRRPETGRTGLGIVLEGAPDEGLSFRLATRDDMLREEPWMPLSEAEQAAIEARREARRQAMLPKRQRRTPAEPGGSDVP